MGQVLHGSATTTEAVRRAIQLRQESVRALAKRYGVSPTLQGSATTIAVSRYAPSPPELANECRVILAPLYAERHQMRRIIDAEVIPQPNLAKAAQCNRAIKQAKDAVTRWREDIRRSMVARAEPPGETPVETLARVAGISVDAAKSRLSATEPLLRDPDDR